MKYTIKKADLKANPALKKKGYKVGQEVEVPIDGDLHDTGIDPTTLPDPDVALNLTKERDERCNPIVLEMLEKMLDKNLLFNDKDYIKAKIKQHLEYMMQNIIVEHVGYIVEKFDQSLMESFNVASEKMWSVAREDLTVKDIEDKLKLEKG